MSDEQDRLQIGGTPEGHRKAPRNPGKLHLLVMNQFFWPDTAPTGQLLSDVARAIGDDNARTTAICANSQYGIQDTVPGPAVRVLRSWSIPFSRTTIGRLMSYASFLLGAVWNGYRIRRPDILLTLTTPPLTSVLGRLIQLMRGCRHYIWEMDVYPDIAVDIGRLRADSLVTALIGLLADWTRRKADGVIVLGDEMKTRLIARGIPEDRIFVAENWADGSEITPQPFSSSRFVVHYSGTLGLAHDVDTILGAIEHFRGDSRFSFVLAGGGARRKYFEDQCRERDCKNVDFRPYCCRDELASSLAEGHVGLVTQLPQTCGSIVPSKTYGIMAAGRPILYIGPPDATPAAIIDRYTCGWRIDPGDVEGLIRLLKRLEVDRRLVEDAGRNGRQAFELHFDRPIGVRRIATILGLNRTYDPTCNYWRDSVPAFATDFAPHSERIS